MAYYFSKGKYLKSYKPSVSDWEGHADGHKVTFDSGDIGETDNGFNVVRRWCIEKSDKPSFFGKIKAFFHK